MCLTLNNSTGKGSTSLLKNINERLFLRYNNPALPVFTVYKALFTLSVILQVEPGEAHVQRTSHLDVHTSKHLKCCEPSFHPKTWHENTSV